MCTFLYCYIISQQGWQNAGKYDIFHVSGIYRQIPPNTGKYQKIEFTTLELKQKATLTYSTFMVNVNNIGYKGNALGTGPVILFNYRKEVLEGIFLLHDE